MSAALKQQIADPSAGYQVGCPALLDPYQIWLTANAVTALGGDSTAAVGIDPDAYLSSALRRIADHLIHRIQDLLAWNLVPANPPATEAA